jgi:hypothetical protein
MTAWLAVVIASSPGPGGRTRRFHLCLREGRVLLEQRSPSLRQLPHHAGSSRRLGQIESSLGRDLQRLSYACCVYPEVFHQGRTRILSFARLYHGRVHEPIQIKDRSLRVTENACRKCHQNVVHDIEAVKGYSNAISCVRCHASASGRISGCLKSRDCRLSALD